MRTFHEGILEWKPNALDRVWPSLPRKPLDRKQIFYLKMAVAENSYFLSPGIQKDLTKTRYTDVSITTPSSWVIKYDQSFG